MVMKKKNIMGLAMIIIGSISGIMGVRLYKSGKQLDREALETKKDEEEETND